MTKEMVLPILLFMSLCSVFGAEDVDSLKQQLARMHVTQSERGASENIDVSVLEKYFSGSRLGDNGYAMRVKLRGPHVLSHYNKIIAGLKESYQVDLIPLKSERPLEEKINIIKKLPCSSSFKLDINTTMTFHVKRFLSDVWGIKEGDLANEEQ